MTKSRSKVVEIIARELEVEKEAVSEECFLDTLGVDSPHLLEIALAIEEEFEIEISDTDLIRFHTVSDIITYVNDQEGA
ncbi:phosphopantetheine-binding protein [Sorangium sp. So ce327]|uniref:phosphopantetheine-binding protein n=1 Tax=Sorangium sp. So ce327 TaxID=3133301 RepID=UPI003F5DF52B